MSVATTTPTVTTASPNWAKIALRWMPTFLGFPAGGFVAEIVGRVDNPTHAIAGGAITGAIVGCAQWIGMRRTGLSPIAWIVATALGFAAGLGLGAGAIDYRTSVGALATQGLVTGAVIGVAQAAVLYRRLGRIAVAWPAFVAGLWSLGWTITASAGIDVQAQYTSFGSSGAIAVTAALSVLPIALARRRAPMRPLRLRHDGEVTMRARRDSEDRRA